MIIEIALALYSLVCLVVARVAYTKYHFGEWFTEKQGFVGSDVLFCMFTLVCLWPIALVGGAAVWFVTGTVRKRERGASE